MECKARECFSVNLKCEVQDETLLAELDFPAAEPELATSVASEEVAAQIRETARQMTTGLVMSVASEEAAAQTRLVARQVTTGLVTSVASEEAAAQTREAARQVTTGTAAVPVEPIEQEQAELLAIHKAPAGWPRINCSYTTTSTTLSRCRCAA